MEHKNCLNCQTKLISNYCQQCGQKAETHRITLRHFIAHDILHGVWHLEKGLLYTVKESFFRPGYMAMDYISGKRIKYYNIFYLLLLVLGLNVLTAHLLKQYFHINDVVTNKVVREDALDISSFVNHNFKLLLFLSIPFIAFAGWSSFRKLKLNIAEHAIIAGNVLLTGAIWTFFYIVLRYTIFPLRIGLFVAGFILLFAMIILVPTQVYYQATRKKYSKGEFLLRLIQWFGFIWGEFFFVLFIAYLFTGKLHFQL
jgi:hypothetical protein